MENDRELLRSTTSIRNRISIQPHWYSYAAKRLMDIVASLLGLFLLAPFLVLIAAWIKRDSPGSVFYRGRRMGRGGKDFGILKFRTMRDEQASYAGPCITAQDDPRITPLGKWLRDTKLNELPQLWNVLVGEMSLVGPRPEDPGIAANWPEAMRREILSLRPGITSPASILYRDEEKLLKSASVMDDYLKDVMPDKLRLDQLYVRNCNFFSDLDVLFLTVIVLLPSLHNGPIPTETLYNGPLVRFIRRYLSWFVIDTLVVFIAASLALLLKRMNGPFDLGFNLVLGIAAAIALIFSLVNSLMGLGRISWRHAKADYALDLAFSSGVSTMLVLALDVFWRGVPVFPPGTIIVTGLLAFLGFVSVRYRVRLLTGLVSRWLSRRKQAGGLGERVLIVGAGECGLLASWLIHRSRVASAFSIVGMVDDDPGKQGLNIDGHHVFGMTPRIPSLVEEQDIGVILFAIEQIHPLEQSRILDLCRQTSARVVLIPDLMSIFRERLTQSSAAQSA